MRSIPLTNTADAYTAATEFTAPEIVEFDFTVSNASVVYQLGMGWPGVSWLNEVDQLPKNVVIAQEGYTGIRFRSKVTGTPGTISGKIKQRWD